MPRPKNTSNLPPLSRDQTMQESRSINLRKNRDKRMTEENERLGLDKVNKPRKPRRSNERPDIDITDANLSSNDVSSDLIDVSSDLIDDNLPSNRDQLFASTGSNINELSSITNTQQPISESQSLPPTTIPIHLRPYISYPWESPPPIAKSDPERGRPPKLYNPQIYFYLISGILDNIPIEILADQLRMARQTPARWVKWGRQLAIAVDDDRLSYKSLIGRELMYFHFYLDVSKADATVKSGVIERYNRYVTRGKRTYKRTKRGELIEFVDPKTMKIKHKHVMYVDREDFTVEERPELVQHYLASRVGEIYGGVFQDKLDVAPEIPDIDDVPLGELPEDVQRALVMAYNKRSKD